MWWVKKIGGREKEDRNDKIEGGKRRDERRHGGKQTVVYGKHPLTT